MSWVAVGVAVVTTAYSGVQQYQNSKYQQKQAEADANAVQAQGRLEAERIRKDKEKAKSSARAAAAANGLSVNDGTAVIINDEIENAGNYDANIAEITGYNSSQRLKAEANTYKKNAKTAAIGTALNTVTSGISTYGVRGGWK